mmetsp:Transcript_25909/g.61478  ORF Transcript_25909/g.61478 Transcript_25909/m.61478 type:complete len:305 (+) Transcript_25909:593-1507(+)
MAETDTPSGFNFWYMASKVPISISVVTWNDGTVKVATMLLLTAFCIPLNGTKPSGKSTTGSPPDATRLRSGCFSPVAIFTSSTVTRPNSPVPWIVARSILAFLAAARAMGVAAITPAAGVHEGLVGAAAAGLAAAGADPEAAASTSEAVIRPSGPVPATVLISIPNSSAFFLARGDATTRAPGALAAAGAAALGVTAAGAATAEAAGAAAAGAPDKDAAYAWRAGMSLSSAAINATGEPTSVASPSSVIMAARKPSSNASTSMSALSLSTTMMASPAEIGSPSAFNHETTLPSFMVDERAGIST